MGRKKIDNRIRTLIENGVELGHRTMFVVVGDKARDQVVILHHMLCKAAVRARPTVLWCYKKELGFGSHRRKRMRVLQKRMQHGQLNATAADDDDPFELFVASTKIRYCYYKETHKILGTTFGMCVLQDFEALTPNLLARTVETVEGGGMVVLLLHSVSSLRQLFTLAMDVHARYRTAAHQHVVCRFNERFILSLADCRHALVLDDRLNVLPLSRHVLDIAAVPRRTADDPPPDHQRRLAELCVSLADTQPMGALAALCRTLDQARALLQCVDALTEKTLRRTVSVTAARGRGKSAALGLALVAAVALDYANVFVTSPSPENLSTLFEFVLKGFDALDYQEHHDYEVIQSTNAAFNRAVVRVNVFRAHRQTIQYIQPNDAAKLSQAELLVIDEAAAIPLPFVKSLLGPYLVFLSSTINGYEGTGRSLSLKLLQQLRQQTSAVAAAGVAAGGVAADAVSGGRHNAVYQNTPCLIRTLSELTLSESIRYRRDDPIEAWLNRLLCLETNVPSVAGGGGPCPVPQDCDLYFISRDTLFSYHRASETFLQRLMAIYVAAHYKNSPNDLQMLSDAPGHMLFCLLGPVGGDGDCPVLPEVLCLLQVCLEGDISRASVMDGLSRGKRAAGDLIPWNVAQQFQDNEFASLSGARIVRIATHPDYQRMGYGTRAVELLQQYFELRFPPLAGSVADQNRSVKDIAEDSAADQLEDGAESVSLLHERLAPRTQLPPLLLRLHERPPERLHYLGVSYGLTEPLLKFWKRAGYVPVYLRQTANDITAEHTCIMLKSLSSDGVANEEDMIHPSAIAKRHTATWLPQFFADFRRRFVALLGFQFAAFPASMALSVLSGYTATVAHVVGDRKSGTNDAPLSRSELEVFISSYDLRRLELYSSNMADYHLITDLLPALARLYVLRRFEQQQQSKSQDTGVDGVTASAATCRLSPVQVCLLIGLGLQHKTVDQLAAELGVACSQLLGLFNRTVRKMTACVRAVFEQSVVDGELSALRGGDLSAPAMRPAAKTIDEELDEAATELENKRREQLRQLQEVDLSEYMIKGSEDDWRSALGNVNKKSTVLSVKTEEKPILKIVDESGDFGADITPPSHQGSGKKRKFKDALKNHQQKSHSKRKWKSSSGR